MNHGPQKPTSYYPDSMNGTLLGKRIFAGIIKDPPMRSSCMARVDLNPMTGVFVRGREEEATEMEAEVE